MPTNWITPTPDGLAVVMDEQVLAPLAGKAAALRLTVARVRGAVSQSQHVPVSATAGSVPPEGEEHTLVMAVALLAAARPNLAQLADEGGHQTGFGARVERAERWLDAVLKGRDEQGRVFTVTMPTDPVGRDGATAASDDNPLYEAVRVGSSGLVEEADLTPYSSTVTA
jgi:hypothetical protein